MRNHVLLPLLIVAALVPFAIAIPAAAQQTFFVTVAAKSAQHPTPGGWPETYLIDGVEAAELTLIRGETYTFQMQNVDGLHPFYISSNASGGGAGVFSDGVTGNFVIGNDALTFTVPDTAPDLLYYQCSNHALMGGVLNIVSSGTDVERDEQPSEMRLDQNYPNPFNPETQIAFELDATTPVTLTVFDAAGRELRVLVDATLSAGSHTVTWDGRTSEGRPAPSGTYIYRLETPSASQSRSMTLLR